MTDKKDLAIKKIEKEFEELSNLVLEQLQLLNELFTSGKKSGQEEIFQKLCSNEEKIDQYEVQIEDRVIKAIVLYHPVATDLRRLFSIYHMTINLERVGDLVQRIGTTFVDLRDSGYLEESVTTLVNLLKITSKMVSRSLLSYINKDRESAIRTLRTDMAFDEMNKKLLKKGIKSAGLPKKSQALLNNLVDMRAMLSSIERIGDHAANIAEASIYAISGSNVRHVGSLKE
jgi:phosphate transport system protein